MQVKRRIRHGAAHRLYLAVLATAAPPLGYVIPIVLSEVKWASKFRLWWAVGLPSVAAESYRQNKEDGGCDVWRRGPRQGRP
jgi:hypothetical protein